MTKSTVTNSGLPIKVNTICFVVFMLMQVPVIQVFLNVGRDNVEYVRLFSQEDTNYLEPFWILLSNILRTLGVFSPELALYCMLALSILGALLFLRSVTRFEGIQPLSYFFILIAIFSYQISLVTGALRQSISFFFFSSFIVTASESYLAVAALAHVSGLPYLFYSKFRLAFISAALIGVSVVGLTESGFLSSAVLRLEGYLGAEVTLSGATVFMFVTQKMVIFLLFIRNRLTLFSHLKSHFFAYSLICAPIVQSIVYILFPTPIITDRLNLIFDPFVLVGLVFVSMRLDVVNFLVLIALIVPKLMARMYFAFS